MNAIVIIAMLFFIVVWAFVMAWKMGYVKFLGNDVKLGRQGVTIQKSEAQESMEQHSLIEKGRPLVWLKFRFLAYWIIAMAILVVSARWIGRPVLFLLPAVSIVLYIICSRSFMRRFISMVVATPCPQCGQLPMRYEFVRNQNRHLLICDKCHVEWSLGPI